MMECIDVIKKQTGSFTVIKSDKTKSMFPPKELVQSKSKVFQCVIPSACRPFQSYRWRWLTLSRKWRWPTCRLISWPAFRNTLSSHRLRSPRFLTIHDSTRESDACESSFKHVCTHIYQSTKNHLHPTPAMNLNTLSHLRGSAAWSLTRSKQTPLSWGQVWISCTNVKPPCSPLSISTSIEQPASADHPCLTEIVFIISNNHICWLEQRLTFVKRKHNENTSWTSMNQREHYCCHTET